MATETPTTIESRIREIEVNIDRLSRVNTIIAPYPSSEKRPWLERWFPGISLVVIAGFAFGLGMINATVNNTAARMEKVYSIILESRDSLTTRTSVLEAKLDTITTRTSVLEAKLDTIDKKLDDALDRPTSKSSKR